MRAYKKNPWIACSFVGIIALLTGWSCTPSKDASSSSPSASGITSATVVSTTQSTGKAVSTVSFVPPDSSIPTINPRDTNAVDYKDDSWKYKYMQMDQWNLMVKDLLPINLDSQTVDGKEKVILSNQKIKVTLEIPKGWEAYQILDPKYRSLGNNFTYFVGLEFLKYSAYVSFYQYDLGFADDEGYGTKKAALSKRQKDTAYWALQHIANNGNLINFPEYELFGLWWHGEYSPVEHYYYDFLQGKESIFRGVGFTYSDHIDTSFNPKYTAVMIHLVKRLIILLEVSLDSFEELNPYLGKLVGIDGITPQTWKQSMNDAQNYMQMLYKKNDSPLRQFILNIVSIMQSITIEGTGKAKEF